MAFTVEELREAAAHRGLKLVKSRKRKPGVGDYGLFGLADAGGKPLFGIDKDGLTATPAQIIEFLRKGEVSTWAASAESIPDRPKTAGERKSAEGADEDDAGPSAIRPRKPRSAARPAPTARESDEASANRATRSQTPDDRPKPGSRHKAEAEPSPTSEPEPAPELVVRAAQPKDAAALHGLLAPLDLDISAAGLKRAVSSATTRNEPVLVAEKRDIVGCLAWHIIPGLALGDVARITMIFVSEDARRQGIGRALFESALHEVKERKVQLIEAMSDIELRNANGFYRAVGLRQASYRFATDILSKRAAS